MVNITIIMIITISMCTYNVIRAIDLHEARRSSVGDRSKPGDSKPQCFASLYCQTDLCAWQDGSALVTEANPATVSNRMLSQFCAWQEGSLLVTEVNPVTEK